MLRPLLGVVVAARNRASRSAAARRTIAGWDASEMAACSLAMVLGFMSSSFRRQATPEIVQRF